MCSHRLARHLQRVGQFVLFELMSLFRFHLLPTRVLHPVATAMVSPGRFELPTSRLGGARSIHLSYGDLNSPTPEFT